MKLLCGLSLFFLVVSCLCNGNLRASNFKPLTPTESYTNFISFDEDNKEQYMLYWKYDKDEIQMEIHVKTLGWVGLGISPNGGMAGADIIIGWVDKSGKPIAKDCYATSATKPIIDEEQNIVLLDGAEVNGYTIMKYKRKLLTCDKDDQEINIGTMFLIAGWNDEDPETGQNDWKYHGSNRFTKALIFLNYKNQVIEDQLALPDDVLKFDIRMPNITIGSKDTYYYCDIFELPMFDTNVHLIQFEVILNKTNKNFVHHFLGYECAEGFVPTEKLARECGYNPIPDTFTKNCMDQLVVAWGVGGEHIYRFPKEAGYPFEPTTKKRYMFMQMHYDNPRLESGRKDDSGVRLFITKKLRQHDLGLLQLSGTVLQIPPKVDSMTLSTVCYPECTQARFPEDGINVVSGMLHTHLAGKKIRTSVVRNNKAIGYLFDNPNYDFNYQYVIDIEPTKLYKGDALITECMYNTMDRNNITWLGYGTRDEMCINYIYYYPRIENFGLCQSHASPEAVFGFYRSLMNENLIAQMPIDETKFLLVLNKFKTYFEQNVTFTPQLTQKFKDFFEKSQNRTSYCGTTKNIDESNYKRNIPDFKPKELYVEPVKCSISSTTTDTNKINSNTVARTNKCSTMKVDFISVSLLFLVLNLCFYIIKE